METKIWIGKGYKTIKPEDWVSTTRRLTSFCNYNCMRNALFKSQGGWYWLRKDGILEFVSRTLYLITFDQLFKLKDL